ncbi:MAG: DNA repair protein RecO [Patescibacteria group bacterium]|nr:DNA repair protein RecO [Patescibacteria group bacterium]
MREFRTKGLILKSRNLGENDKVVTILTPDLGKIEAKARGARRITSKLCGHLEILSVCDFALYKSTRGLFTITQGKQLKSFQALKGNLKLINEAIEIIELINLNTAEEQPIEGIFETTSRALLKMEKAKDKTEKITEEYLRDLLDILGLLPHREISRKKLKEIIMDHINLPHSFLSTRKTFWTRSSLSKILSN